MWEKVLQEEKESGGREEEKVGKVEEGDAPAASTSLTSSIPLNLRSSGAAAAKSGGSRGVEERRRVSKVEVQFECAAMAADCNLAARGCRHTDERQHSFVLQQQSRNV